MSVLSSLSVGKGARYPMNSAGCCAGGGRPWFARKLRRPVRCGGGMALSASLQRAVERRGPEPGREGACPVGVGRG